MKDTKSDMEKDSTSESELNREEVIVDTDKEDDNSVLVHIPK